MSEGVKIALTAVSGIAVFVIGQITQKILVEPIQEQRKLIGEIVHALVFYANLFHSVSAFKEYSNVRRQSDKLEGRQTEILDEAYELTKRKTAEGTEKLRRLSSEIHQSIQVIPCYWVLENLGLVHKRKNLYQVAIKLIQWANTSEQESTNECRHDIAQLLNVKYVSQALRESE